MYERTFSHLKNLFTHWCSQESKSVDVVAHSSSSKCCYDVKLASRCRQMLLYTSSTHTHRQTACSASSSGYETHMRFLRDGNDGMLVIMMPVAHNRKDVKNILLKMNNYQKYRTRMYFWNELTCNSSSFQCSLTLQSRNVTHAPFSLVTSSYLHSLAVLRNSSSSSPSYDKK